MTNGFYHLYGPVNDYADLMWTEAI
jgi:hypothetical protein